MTTTPYRGCLSLSATFDGLKEQEIFPSHLSNRPTLHSLAATQKWLLEVLVGRVCCFNIANMSSFDSNFWNLSQAAAWVVYRSKELVEQFSQQSENEWKGLIIFPEKPEHELVDKLGSLAKALKQGRLKAWGRRKSGDGDLEAIPARE